MTKKMLVAWNPTKTRSASTIFLFPFIDGENRSLCKIGSHELSKYGMVVFTGKNLTANDLFARVVDSGISIPNVDRLIQILNSYLTEIKTLKVGNIVSVNAYHEDSILKFEAQSPSSFGPD